MAPPLSAWQPSAASSPEFNFRELDDVFLQNQTRIWIGEVLQARLDENQNVADLLADGELLFEVSKIIWKIMLTSCPEIRHSEANKCTAVAWRKSSGRYRPYSNVDSFLKMCRFFGLASIDLFSSSDVVEKKDTRRVCIVIRALSKKARTEKLNLPDFDVVTYTIAMPRYMVGSIRRSLEKSQWRSLTSTGSDEHEDSSECKQGFTIASEDPGDMESHCLCPQSSVSCTDFCYCSNDSSVSLNSDLENSPGVTSKLIMYSSSPKGLQSDIIDSKKDVDCGSPRSTYPIGFFFDGDFLDCCTPKSGQQMHHVPISLNENNCIETLLFDDDDSIPCMDSESDDMTHPTLKIGFEDSEAASTASISSVLSRVQQLDFDGHRDWLIEDGDFGPDIHGLQPWQALDLEEDANRLNDQDERKLESLGNPASDMANEKENMGMGARPHISRTLLKIAMSSTLVFGLFFLYDHFRKSNGASGMDGFGKRQKEIRRLASSSNKQERGGNRNGFYPAEKLRMGN